MEQKTMEVGVYVETVDGRKETGVMTMPAGSYVPIIGDKLLFDEKVCVVTERQFQVVTGSDRNHCNYAWSIHAKQK